MAEGSPPPEVAAQAEASEPRAAEPTIGTGSVVALGCLLLLLLLVVVAFLLLPRLR